MKGLKGFAALLTAVVSIGAAGAIGTQRTEQEVHLYGIVRYETTGWVLLNNATHQSSGLGAVECEVGSGELRVDYLTPLTKVGTAAVTVDETYAGPVVVGASVGLNSIYLMFKTPTGTKIHCSSSTLQRNNSNGFIDLWGMALV